MQVVYEDNHIIIVSKRSGEIVQGDKTGDEPLSETVKQYIKEKYHKLGNVFLGVVHRLDRPVSGLVVFAKTSKALSRLNNMFRDGEVHKTYWAIVKNMPKEPEATLTHWIVRNEKQNKSYAYDHEVKNSKKAILKYKVIGHTDHYTLLEVNLMTGRHHQIRCQLAKMGCPIKGDLKYGSPRSNADGSISLLSHRVEFVHPVSKETIVAEAPLPDDNLWRAAYASESTGMDISVKQVRLVFPLKLGVEGVKVLQPIDSLKNSPNLALRNKRDTVADIRKMVVDVQLLPLFESQVMVDELNFTQMKVNTGRTERYCAAGYYA